MEPSRPPQLNHAFSFENPDEASAQAGSQQQQRQQQQQQQQRQGQQQYEAYRYAEPYRDNYGPPQDQRSSPYVGSSPARDHSVGQASPPQLFHHPAAHPASSYSRLQASRRISASSVSLPQDHHYPTRENIDYTAPASPTFYPEEVDTRRNHGLPTQEAEHIARRPVGGAAIPYGSPPAVTSTSSSGPTPQPLPSGPQLPLPTDSSTSRGVSPDREPTLPRLIPTAPAADDNGRYWGQEIGYSMPTATASRSTPGMDNVGEASVGGGVTGLAMGVAANNQRESGVQALQAIENGGHAGPPGQEGTPSTVRPNNQQMLLHQGSSSSLRRSIVGMPPVQGPSRLNTSDNGSLGSSRSQDRYVGDYGSHYADNPHRWDPRVSQTGFVGGINPDEIANDADDGLTYGNQDPRRRSVLSLGRQSTHSSPTGPTGPTGTAARSGAAGGGVLGVFGGLVGRNSAGAHPEPSSSAYGLVSGSGEPAAYENNNEKSEWLNQQTTGNKKMKWIVGIIIAIVVAAAIAGGIAGGIIGSRKNSSSGSNGSSGDSNSPGSVVDNGPDLSKNSPEIKKLLNNPNLHKVFPGMDYTPLNAATYPDCLAVPPNQNNVTRDIAVMSQLTNTIRLYGTDCNQTEMILHSIKTLGVDMKLWLGVWQDNNATTNARQLDHMYSIFDQYGADPFLGVIVGNEILFRKDMTEPQLMKIISDVKTNLTAKDIKLPMATADLGDNWDSTLAGAVDVVMSNVHPFFAGVTADAAAGWSWDFWQNHNVALTSGLTNKPKYIISEIGWPSDGGNDCGVGVTCTDKTSGSVAGVPEMNTFMDSFVCQSLKNSTTYFWFSAFDEPWKVRFNTAQDQWEDKWGLMDVNRNLKKGVKIPDCGGQTAP
ncbi:MAG: hypothetical protein M1813_005469 [Trichoglossum hirsutum]|nr:MAG: hypothetical protein M1813_005469 [Trichoglossum hirsutum]